MSTLYLVEPGLQLERNKNRLIVKRRGEILKEMPLEKVDSIILIGRSHITSPLITELLEREIPVTWLSNTGKFFGRLESTSRINIERHREQFRRAEDREFCLQLCKTFIEGKIKNSRVILRRCNREKKIERVFEINEGLKYFIQKVNEAKDDNELLGYEGNASKLYLKGLSLLVSKNFSFSGRSRQPPKDPFNSLLSFGYTMLLYNIYTCVVNKGLHPYMGFLHKIKRGHPALCSDLMEEWRPIIVDSIVMNIAQNDVYQMHYFVRPNGENGGIYLDKLTSKDFIQRFDTKINDNIKYLPYVEYPANFKESIMFQAGALAKAIEEKDPSIYKAVVIK